MQTTQRSRIRLSRLADRAAGVAITLAGVVVIVSMIAMLVLIVREAAPLFLPASVRVSGTAGLPDGVSGDDIVAMAVDADLRNTARAAVLLLRDGRLDCLAMGPDGSSFSFHGEAAAGSAAPVRAVEEEGGGYFSLLRDDCTLSRIRLGATFSEDGVPVPEMREVVSIALDPGRGMPAHAMLRGDASAHAAVVLYDDGSLLHRTLKPGRGLTARGRGVTAERETRIRFPDRPTCAVLNDEATRAYFGTAGGDVIPVDIAGGLAWETVPVFRDRRAVTALSFLNGGYAVAIGDREGGTSVWFPRREAGVFRFRQSVAWPDTAGPVRQIVPSRRDRGFLALREDGGIGWYYSTTGRKLLEFQGSPDPVRIALNDRADTLVGLGRDNRLEFRRLDAGNPEAGWAGFFRKLLYEGYETPAFVWQSTGSDASEPKLSLVPLLWGSVKGAIYALFFATPIALAAAVGLSQFTGPVWRARLKPAVEMLAAVPSVVIGFLAALWLAPLLERYVRVFIGNASYDQRNSLVIAIAMGFAVIPTIFSLAEDALSAVPPSLSAASLALGASRWQTVWRVVLPTASPGIFTAVMLGLGRAVGETMIVLMAAGNTPIISLSPFNGMRTLSANIAVEMPEAPVGGTLYRTLFLCALLLFLLTLIINTAAEVFRHRLRQRYGRL